MWEAVLAHPQWEITRDDLEGPSQRFSPPLDRHPPYTSNPNYLGSIDRDSPEYENFQDPIEFRPGDFFGPYRIERVHITEEFPRDHHFPNGHSVMKKYKIKAWMRHPISNETRTFKIIAIQQTDHLDRPEWYANHMINNPHLYSNQ
ncbi:MAG: hypothetical protein HRT90_03180 [Candidatus Margulisbacteria bacterium]|nr:hypothetical protein [Candidatus Margulisiibacteriota bacterium]